MWSEIAYVISLIPSRKKSYISSFMNVKLILKTSNGFLTEFCMKIEIRLTYTCGDPNAWWFKVSLTLLTKAASLLL